MPKALTSKLPKGSPYTFIEAFISVAVDYDNNSPVTVKGYADLWKWSRGKVERFLEEIGSVIQYSRDTRDVQKQRGKLEIRRAENEQKEDRNRTENGQIILIDSKWLSEAPNRKEAESGQKAGRRQGTTIYPNPKPILKTLPAKQQPAGFSLFRDWWMHAFSVIEGDAYIFEGGKDGSCLSSMLRSLDWKELVCRACHYLTDPNRFPRDERPQISLLKSSINKYPGHVNGKADHFRDMGLLPAEGVMLENWCPWKNQLETENFDEKKRQKAT